MKKKDKTFKIQDYNTLLIAKRVLKDQVQTQEDQMIDRIASLRNITTLINKRIRKRTGGGDKLSVQNVIKQVSSVTLQRLFGRFAKNEKSRTVIIVATTLSSLVLAGIASRKINKYLDKIEREY